MTSSRARDGLRVAVGALALGFASFTAAAETLGTLPSGKVVTPGTVTTTGPDGVVTTRPAQVYSPAAPASPPASAQPRPTPSTGMPPVSEEGDGPSSLPASGAALREGPQPIMPPGFGATSPHSGPSSGAAFPGGTAPDARGVTAIGVVPGRANSGIQMGELGGVDASAAGLIGADDGGFGPDMWRGTTRADVEHNLSIMPVATSSPLVNELSRRLLLTSATPPEGGASGTSLLAVRLQRLTAAGRADLASELGQSARADTSGPVAVARARAALALGQDEEACSELGDIPAGNDPAHDEADAFSTKLSAFCQIRSGNKAAANLTLDLAREEGLDDPLFFSLAAQATDGLKLKAAEPKVIDILDARLYKLAKREMPKTAGSIAVPALVKVLAQDESLPAQTRIEAGERAVMIGLIKPDELAALYKLPSFKPDDLDNAKIGKFPAAGALRRAVLYQAIDAEVLPTERIEMMKQMFATGEAGGVYPATVGVMLPMLGALEPSPALKNLAPAAVRAFLLAGDRPHAQIWYALVAPQGEAGGPAIGRDGRELSALMRMSDPNGPGALTERIAAEIVADLNSGVADTQNFGASEAMLFDAFGQPLPQSILEVLGKAPRSVGAPEALLNQLHNAGLRGSVGEVVLLSLIAIGPGGPDRADRQAVAQSVSSLRAVHLDGEARRLATEALMGRSHAGRG